jgi:uncharacterized protein (DUF2062 family)
VRARDRLEWLVRLRGSPRAIAGGVAIGLVVAFSPTIGFQTLLALGIATLLNASRPAAIVPVWVTNPVTIPPIYAFTYYVGSFFWPGAGAQAVTRAIADAAAELNALGFLALRAQLDVFLGLGADVLVPMTIGGLVVGSAAAAVAYPFTLYAVTALRARRAGPAPPP